jgi:hypothetical protein
MVAYVGAKICMVVAESKRAPALRRRETERPSPGQSTGVEVQSFTVSRSSVVGTVQKRGLGAVASSVTGSQLCHVLLAYMHSLLLN